MGDWWMQEIIFVPPPPEKFINTLRLLWPSVYFVFCLFLRSLKLVVSFILMCFLGLAQCYTWSTTAITCLFHPWCFQIWELCDLQISIDLIGPLSQLCKTSVFFQSLFFPSLFDLYFVNDPVLLQHSFFPFLGSVHLLLTSVFYHPL